MKLLKLGLAVFCFAIANTFTYAQETNEAKAKSIIEKGIDAMGGKELFSNIKTLYTKSATITDGRNVYFITKEMAPNLGSFEIEYEGRTVYRSWFDGSTGFEMVNGQKKLADQEEFKDKPGRKYIMNELAYLDPSLYKVEFVDTDKAENLHKIKATATDGSVVNLFYDTKDFLLKKEIKENPVKNSFSTILCEKYKKFKGLVHCSKTVLRSEDGDQILNLVDLSYNKNIDKKDFK